MNATLEEQGVVMEDFFTEVEKISQKITELDLSLLGKKTKPPAGY